MFQSTGPVTIPNEVPWWYDVAEAIGYDSYRRTEIVNDEFVTGTQAEIDATIIAEEAKQFLTGTATKIVVYGAVAYIGFKLISNGVDHATKKAVKGAL
jgi:pyrroloquinoline quinone (PQQ) biosynthesis protein C